MYMSRVATVVQRKIEKQNLLAYLKEHSTMPLDDALALYSMETGFSLTTLHIYCRELKAAKMIEVK